MKYDLKYLSVPLPEEIQRVKEFGDFASADIAIDFWLTKELPQALKERLIIEKDVIKMMRMNEYPHSFAKADERHFSGLSNRGINSFKRNGISGLGLY